MTDSAKPALRVLIVDDSAMNRRSIQTAFEESGEIIVVGTASNGSEALQLAHRLRPDAITLDLEMPKMDGFSFLRLLMSARPTPVIVVSSYSQKENVFKALELGAVDFVAKPEGAADEIASIRKILLQKVLMARTLRRGAFSIRPGTPARAATDRPALAAPRLVPRYIVVVASSTGGPTAVTEIVSHVSARGPYALLIAQHMPEKFTRTFAERLDRYSSLKIAEAKTGDVVSAGTAFVCPGRQCMTLEQNAEGQYCLRVGPPGPDDRYVPSANRLFSSAARVAGSRAIGVVLTGMGDDGVEGAKRIIEAGGVVLAESEETAVVYGMPRAAVRAQAVTRSLPIHEMADALMGLVGR